MLISLPSPKTVLRIGMIFCLAGAPAMAILGLRIVDSRSTFPAHALSVMLFTLFFPFALLYVEYEIAQKITKCELNVRIVYIQSLDCVALWLYGIAASLV